MRTSGARRLVVLLASSLLSGCVPLGWRFGPGFSCEDTALFAEPPVVVHRSDGSFLAWTQGTYPFFFEPSYEAKSGRLVFAMAATASSGHLAGHRREVKIVGAENLDALRRGGAFWWDPGPEPSGRLVALRIVDVSPP